MVLELELISLKFSLNNKYDLTTTIKANKKLFNFVFVVNIYIKIFTFGEKKLQI